MHQTFMQAALDEARLAFTEGEVPIGAVMVYTEQVIAADHNRTEQWHDPLAHAEMLVIRAACAALGYERLEGASLYVTVEPCVMCAGAIVLSRITQVVYGTANPKAGAIRSLYALTQDQRLNHQTDVVSGILHDECAGLMSSFFQQIRQGEVPKWS